MNIEISVPDELFSAAAELANRLGVSRSQLYASALAEFVAMHGSSEVTDRLNELYARIDSSLDPGFRRIQARSIEPPPRSDAMSTVADEIQQIESKILSLPRDARLHLREAINASLDIDPEIERAWNEEILRRLAEIRSGRAEMIDGEEFDRELNDLVK